MNVEISFTINNNSEGYGTENTQEDVNAVLKIAEAKLVEYIEENWPGSDMEIRRVNHFGYSNGDSTTAYENDEQKADIEQDIDNAWDRFMNEAWDAYLAKRQ